VCVCVCHSVCGFQSCWYCTNKHKNTNTQTHKQVLQLHCCDTTIADRKNAKNRCSRFKRLDFTVKNKETHFACVCVDCVCALCVFCVCVCVCVCVLCVCVCVCVCTCVVLVVSVGLRVVGRCVGVCVCVLCVCVFLFVSVHVCIVNERYFVFMCTMF